MPSKLSELVSKGLATPSPSGIDQQIHYEVYMGSQAYGVSSDSSDMDVNGFVIENKNLIFPHLSGYIDGFGKRPPRFETYHQAHIIDKSELGGKGRTYDYTIHSIVKFFNLVMTNNPNMVDSLFVPLRCILHITPIGQMVRDNRHMFLTKRCYHSFRGYAFEQLHKLRTKEPSKDSKRRELIDKYGFDTKFAYHIVRLMDECEMILTECDLDLERSREVLKSIRRGEWTLDEIENYFKDNEQRLREVCDKSKLPYAPDEERIKNLLIDCLEQCFGNLNDAVVKQTKEGLFFKEINEVVDRYKGQF